MHTSIHRDTPARAAPRQLVGAPPAQIFPPPSWHRGCPSRHPSLDRRRGFVRCHSGRPSTDRTHAAVRSLALPFQGVHMVCRTMLAGWQCALWCTLGGDNQVRSNVWAVTPSSPHHPGFTCGCGQCIMALTKAGVCGLLSRVGSFVCTGFCFYVLTAARVRRSLQN